MEVMEQLSLSNCPLLVFLIVENTTYRNMQRVMVMLPPLIQALFCLLVYLLVLYLILVQ